VRSDILVEPIVASCNNQSQSKQRHFSSFPLTSHLHNPAFRLVSLHSSLEVVLSFLRVPEIHDGYEYKVFVSRSTIVEDVITRVIDELGLAKSLPIPGAGNLEYIVEEVWVDGQNECMFQQYPCLR
jgi:diaphanous 1